MIDRTFKNLEFWLAIALVGLAILLLFQYHPEVVVTVHPIYHWFSWIGGTYIAIAIPLFSWLKRKYQTKYQLEIQGHIFGNLLAFALVSLHVTYQIGTPPILGTFTHLGLEIYVTFVFSIISGFILRYQLMKKYIKPMRFFHISLITTFYLTLLIHILHGLDII